MTSDPLTTEDTSFEMTDIRIPHQIVVQAFSPNRRREARAALGVLTSCNEELLNMTAGNFLPWNNFSKFLP